MGDDKSSMWKFRLFMKEKVIPFLYRQFLMIGVICVLIAGLTFPQPGEFVGRFKYSAYICVIVVFLHTGLKLRTAEAKDGLKQYGAFIYGTISILLVSSIVGVKLSQLLPFNDNAGSNHTTNNDVLGPPEFLIGLELYFISPCAISSGIILTTIAGGDIALAVLLSVTTNTLGVVVIPLLAKWLVSVKNVEFDIVSLLTKLVITVIVPLLIGKGVTYIKGVKGVVKKWTKTLKLISIVFLICIPWMKISKANLSGSFEKVSALSIFIMILWLNAVHLILLITNYMGTMLFRFKLTVRKTLVIMPSLKTLAISLSVIAFLPENFGDGGLMSLPLIVGHLCLVLLDSVWVGRWSNITETDEQIIVVDNDGVENDVGEHLYVTAV